MLGSSSGAVWLCKTGHVTQGRDDLALLQRLTSERTETTWLEFKENKADPQMIGENISALANSAVLEGRARSYMVWGVRDDDHMIVGTSFDPLTAKKSNELLVPWLNRLLEPQVHIDFRTVQVGSGLQTVILEVEASRSRPVSFSGTEYVRVGSQTHKLKDYPEHERRLWRAFETDVFEAGVACESASENDVLELLDYGAYYDLFRLSLPETRGGYVRQFEQDGLVVRGAVGWSITNLGAVLFARDMSRFPSIARKQVRVVEYAGNNRVDTVHEQRGTRGYASGFGGLIEYVNSRLPRRESLGSALRTDEAMYPRIIIRELIANMLIHQDFTMTGSGPMIEIFDGRIEITNPGVPLIDVRRFVDYPPRSRNEDTAAVMTAIGVSEQRGSGWDKIAALSEVHQLPAPDISVTESTRVTVFAPKTFAKMTKPERVRAVYLTCLSSSRLG